MKSNFKKIDNNSIPENWEVVRLGEVVKYKKGIKPRILYDNKESNSLPYLTAKYFRDNKVEFYVPQIKENKFIEAIETDIILIWDGSNAGDVFKGLRGVLASTMVKFEIYRDIYSNFLYYFLKTKFNLLNSKTTGSTIPHISKNFLENLLIPLPPLSEQKKIAAVLSTVQRAIEIESKLIERTKELKKSTMHKLFTEGTKGEKQKMTEIGPIPESWEVVRLGDAFDIQQGKQVSKKNRIGNNKKYFLRTANVFWGFIDTTELDIMHFTPEEELKYRLEIGDLLVCEGGDIGRTAMVKTDLKDCYYQNHLHRLRKIDNSILPLFYQYWLMYAIKSNKYFGQANVTTIPNLSASRLKSFIIPKPPLSEQKAIADILSTIDQKIEFHTNKKQKLEELFRTLLHELMTAKIRVNNVNLDFIKMEE